MATSYEGMLAVTAVQFVFWSAVFEGAEPAVRALLSMFSFWGRYEKFKTSFGKMVWQEISLACIIGLQHFIGFAMMFYGVASGTPEWFSYGVTSKVAFAANDLVLVLLGQRRHQGAPGAMRAIMACHHLLVICLGIPISVNFATDGNVRLICMALYGSEAVLALLVPTQYVLNMMTKEGAQMAIALQGGYLAFFCLCRFVVGFLFPRSYLEVIRTLSTDAASVAAVATIVMFVFNGLLAFLLFDRVKKVRKVRKDVTALRLWFEKNQKDKGEDEIVSYLVTKTKVDEAVLCSISDMVRMKVKVGFFKGKGGAAKKA